MQLKSLKLTGLALALGFSAATTSAADLLNDRGLMGEGCIDLRGIRVSVEENGFRGMIEVEVFSDRWWDRPPGELLEAIKEAYLHHT